MARFHLSYDIAESSNLTFANVVEFLIRKEGCTQIEHPVWSTIIFDCSTKDLLAIESDIKRRFPSNFYFALSEVEKGIWKSNSNPKCDEEKQIIKMYLIDSKINTK